MDFLKSIAAGLTAWAIIRELNNPGTFVSKKTTSFPVSKEVFLKIVSESLEEAFDNVFKKPKQLSPPLDFGETWRHSLEEWASPKSVQLVEASKWLSIIKHPCVVLILGKRGSGKSALAYRIVEDLKWTADIYVVGLPFSASQLVPDWVTVQPEIQNVPPNSIIVIDETHLRYHSGSGVKSNSIELTEMLNLSRQRNQTIIFVSQESNQIDRNIFSAVDVVVFKEPSMLQPKFGRPELRDLSNQAETAFRSIPGDKKKWSFVFSQDQGCIGLVESALPSFWSSQLSRAFASTDSSKSKTGKKLSRLERQAEAKRLAGLGNKPAQIARIMGVSKATIKNYLEDYPYIDPKQSS